MKNPISPLISEEWDSLWLLLRNGDKKGLEGLYKASSGELFQYGMTMVANGDFIEDCIHDVFVDLWKYHKSLPKAENVKVYIFKSLSYKIYRESKKLSKWRMEEVSEVHDDRFSVESMESVLIGVQREKTLQLKLAAALQKLPLRQKEVIQYLFFENFSYEEVSKMMGINLRSVYTLAWKAVSSLKKFIVSLFLAVYLGGG
ncbi:RNA polymerase sigma factor [Negadavirga shengliensis]|uniref:RNA polymerase sigma factor n=1 Tax=Negadavirga shengliensis TaxID=1389218 RepID=A0ABV9SZ30_9BACT